MSWQRIEKRRARVLELAKEGFVIHEISKALLVSPWTVSKDLKALGVSTLELRDTKPTKRQRIAYDMRENGATYKTISVELCCSITTARRHVIACKRKLERKKERDQN